MFRRSINPSKNNSFFLLGARGTGKSTFIQTQFLTELNNPHVHTIDLLNSDQEEEYRRRPARLEQLSSDIEWVFIDEVQKIPALLDHVQRLIEQKKHRFILSGSSARKLKRQGANMLAGRAFLEKLFPLTHLEINEKFRLEDILHWGSLPKIFDYQNSEDKEDYLRAYVQSYLKEEVLMEQLVRNIDPFRDFLEIAGQTNAKVISYAQIGKDIGADPKTVESYFQILEDTYLGLRLPGFHRSVRKSQKVHPKFYLFDLGVKRALARGLKDRFSEGTYAYGEAFEHFIILEIYRQNQYRKEDYQLSYLRTKDGAEVDLILSRGKKVILVEIKSYTRVIEKDAKKLSAFCKDIPGSKAYLISRDEETLQIESALCLPWQKALQEIW